MTVFSLTPPLLFNSMMYEHAADSCADEQAE